MSRPVPSPDRGPGDPLVQMILGQPDMSERLIAEHADDGRGRCRACAVGGQRGQRSWPCTIRLAADEADRIERLRRAGGGDPRSRSGP